MNLSQMLDSFYHKLQENSENTAFATDRVKTWINEGYHKVLNFCDWSFLRSGLTYNLPLRSCKPGETSSGTLLYLEDVSGLQKGMYLWVKGRQNIEKVTISHIDYAENVVHLVSPGLNGEYREGDTASVAQVFLPPDTRKIDRVIAKNRQQNTGSVLNFVHKLDFSKTVPLVTDSGTPTHWYVDDVDMSVEGESIAYIAEEGTNSQKVICSTLQGLEDGYYNNWKMVNRTRKKSSRVKNFQIAQNELLLKTAIDSQTSGDSFYIRRELIRLCIYPPPDEEFILIVQYVKTCPDLEDDCDEPQFGPAGQNFHHLPVDYAVAEALLVDKKPDLAGNYREKFYNQLEQFRRSSLYPYNLLVNLKTTDDDDLPGFTL